MDNVLVWMALAFVAGASFGMSVAAGALGGRASPAPAVVMMEQRRPEALEGGGCGTTFFLLILFIGFVLALIVLGS